MRAATKDNPLTSEELLLTTSGRSNLLQPASVRGWRGTKIAKRASNDVIRLLVTIITTKI